jgi:transcriptional regulator with XRE-family HTH domain
MPAASENADVVGFVIGEHSHIANLTASLQIRILPDAFSGRFSQNAIMDEDDDKNGGPNHLRAWMKFRKKKGAQLAADLDITPGMVSDLVNSNRALSAKWLRRLAPQLNTTPGLLLDHDPHTLDADVIEIWINADQRQRLQITEVAKAIIRTGTDD